ncbi:RNA polymerase-binding protein DksA [Thiohalobacter sp.]|uniref:RNA polymerase-binding protein DksA n=1 Tax=Thiohalobacter sp. TaxID=2025948 RepID=UPI00294FF76C|nr:RNA polymerase-binding protein DksA [Thiohalobacter sp.]
MKKAPAKKAAAKKKAVAKKKVAAKKAPARKAAAKKTVAGKRPPAKKKAARKQAPSTRTPHGTIVDDIAPYEESAGEEYMNEAQRAHFRDILLAWKRELMEEVDRTVHHMQDEAANFPDPNDRATQESEFSMELRTRDRERKLIKKIDEALDKLEHNEYGWCDSCGVEIGIRRLEARPTATLCIDCKTLDEIREKHLGK